MYSLSSVRSIHTDGVYQSDPRCDPLRLPANDIWVRGSASDDRVREVIAATLCDAKRSGKVTPYGTGNLIQGPCVSIAGVGTLPLYDGMF